MTRALAAEMLKLRTTRTAWGFLIATVLLTILIGATQFGLNEFVTEEDLRFAFAGTGVLSGLLLVFGIVGTTGEHRHNTITGTFLAEPSRRRVVAAKLIAFALTGALLGIAAMALTVAMGTIWLSIRDIPIDLETSDWTKLIGGGILSSALLGAVGVGIGAIVRNQIGAVVGTLVYLFVVDTAIVALWDAGGDYTLNSAANVVAGTPLEDDPMKWFVGALVLLAWTALLGVGGAELEERRDVV
jgi:ABC-2 type transport system permease protein